MADTIIIPHDAAKDIKYNVQSYLQPFSIEKNKSIAIKRGLGYAVLVVNLIGDKNTGMIIRTSQVMGASKIFIIGRRKYDERTLVGAKHYIDVERIHGIPDPTVLLKDYSPICVEQGGTSLDDVSWKPYLKNDYKPPCFIMGAEDVGIPRDFIDKCSIMPGYMKISIFQHGILRSLNVATANSILLYEYTKAYRISKRQMFE